MPTLKIDNQEVTVEAGTSILKAAEELGIHIPRFCFHHGLSIAGSCRMCLVELRDVPKLIISCATPVKDDMVVYTNSPRVIKARKGIMEFLLLNHPLDCPVCDKAGECDLQDYSYIYGNAESRFREQKIVQPKKDLGPNILIYADRCIMCSRCVRFCQEVSGTEELCVVRRGAYCEIAIHPSRPLDNLLSGNLADICPVGALTSKDFLFRCRVWALTALASICPICARGCNIYLDCATPASAGQGYRPGLFDLGSGDNSERSSLQVMRVRPRRNDAVNGFWICDIGRYGYKFLASQDRLHRPMVRMGSELRPVSWGEALAAAYEGLSKVGRDLVGVGILSPHATNEENLALARLVTRAFPRAALTSLPAPRVGQDVRFKGGFTICAERAANAAGVRNVLQKFRDKSTELGAILQMAQRGELGAVFVFNGDYDPARPAGSLSVLRGASFVMVHDIFLSDLARMADVVFPSAAFAEKSGTFTNVEGYVQHFEAALTPPRDARPDIETVNQFAAMMHVEPITVGENGLR